MVFLSQRIKPNSDHPGDYYTDRKKIFCLNVQAAVDHTGKFRYFAVIAPGKMNDARAYRRCRRLVQWMNRLKGMRGGRYFVTADNAYPLSEVLLIPFRRNQIGGDIYKDSYNFYLSQLRIRIEMAFGRMHTKFRLLRTKMECDLEQQSKFLQAISRLHNFIIDNEGPRQLQPAIIDPNNDELVAGEMEANGIDPMDNGMGDNGFIPVEFDRGDGAPVSARRDAIVLDLGLKEVVRPITNNNTNNDSD